MTSTIEKFGKEAQESDKVTILSILAPFSVMTTADLTSLMSYIQCSSESSVKLVDVKHSISTFLTSSLPQGSFKYAWMMDKLS